MVNHVLVPSCVLDEDSWGKALENVIALDPEGLVKRKTHAGALLKLDAHFGHRLSGHPGDSSQIILARAVWAEAEAFKLYRHLSNSARSFRRHDGARTPLQRRLKAAFKAAVKVPSPPKPTLPFKRSLEDTQEETQQTSCIGDEAEEVGQAEDKWR